MSTAEWSLPAFISPQELLLVFSFSCSAEEGGDWAAWAGTSQVQPTTLAEVMMEHRGGDSQMLSLHMVSNSLYWEFYLGALYSTFNLVQF